MGGFTHLHVHTEYSLLDGAARIPELVAKAAALGQTALAITDHGSMYGVIEFYKECKKQGIKPLVGMEAYVAPRSLDDKEGRADKEYAHLLLIAKNNTGYKNLSMLSSMGFTRGFYYKPRIDYDMLEKYGEGLIVSSACLAGDLPQYILQGREGEARALAARLKASFGADFYIELMDHGIEEEKRVIKPLLRIAAELGIKTIATNDIHYVNKDDAHAQDALLCIQTLSYMDETARMKMQTEEFYVKSEEEMRAIFAYCPEAVDNTAEIAEKCDVSFEFGVLKLPSYDVPDGMGNEEYLQKLCREGLSRRKPNNAEYASRLDYELGVIRDMGYNDYFLIVWDFINFAKSKDIPVGPGRGSAAGSLAAYCLGITDIDPIKYNLLFERFLNPERISMPDIDIDFCYVRRQEVIDYVIEKYGEDRVAQIITFGTMAARSSIRDVGRVLRVPYGEVDKIAKMIASGPGVTIQGSLDQSREFREAYENDATTKEIVDLAKKLEGLSRNASTHAAGVVISAKPIVEYVPLQKNGDSVTTQFPMGTIEELGLLKMDFLGLRTLTVIDDTIKEIKRLDGAEVDFSRMEYDDPKVFELISSGETDGIFQLESAGMRSFMKQLKPDKFEDIIAGISLYRPGPMESIPRYVEGKFKPESVVYDTPQLEPILNNTYGCMVYQEQVMQIVRDLAGYSLGRSDLVRRAMAKKKADVMAKERTGFVEGCLQHGVTEAAANKIFDSMTFFAAYAFNKSHAAAYAVVAYRTAWLKAYYPAEFMAALCNSFIDSIDKIAEYVYVCRAMNIKILPPDINRSYERFRVEKNDGVKAIRFGLGGVKNVGVSACESIRLEREKGGDYADLPSFVDRCGAFLNKRMLEGLVKVGAFDCFGKKRPVLMGVFPQLMDSAVSGKKNNVAGQVSFFESIETDEGVDYPTLPDYSHQQRLFYEKEACGLYISGHPLEGHISVLKQLTQTREIVEAGEDSSARKDNENVSIGGIISAIRAKLTRNNDKMAYVLLEDLTGQVECIAFPKTLTKYAELIREDAMVVFKGRINTRDDQPNVLIIEEAFPLESWSAAPDGRRLYIRCKKERFADVRDVLQRFRGKTGVVFAFENEKPQLLNGLAVSPCELLLQKLCDMLGADNVKLA